MLASKSVQRVARRSCARPRRCSRCCTARPSSCVRPRRPRPVASGQVMTIGERERGGRTRSRRLARARRDGIRASLHVECGTFYRQSASARLVSRLPCRPRSWPPPLAAWLSQATLAFTGAGDARVALLPLSIASRSSSCVAAGAGVWLAWRRGASLAPLWLLALLVAAVAAGVGARRRSSSGPARSRSLVWPAIAVVALALVARRRAVVARSHGWQRLAQRVRAWRPALLALRDLCRRRVAGVPVGSRRRRAALPDHHAEPAEGSTISEIENNHRSGDYRAYFARRPAEAGLPPPRPQRRDLFDPRARPAGARRAGICASRGYHGVVVFLILLAAAGSALAWRLAWLVTRRADAAWFGWAAVTLSATRDLSQLHGVPRRARRRDRADRASGRCCGPKQEAARAAIERIGPVAGCTAPRWRCCRGFTRGLRCIAGSLGALILLRLGSTTQRGREGGRVPADPRGQRALLGRVLHRHLRHARSVGAVRRMREGRPAFIPGGLVGLLFDQRFGAARVRAGAGLSPLPGSVAMVRTGSMPAAGPRAAVRPGAVPARGHALRDVVGRHQRTGTVLRADAADAGDPGGGRLDRDPPSRHAGERRGSARADRVHLGGRSYSSTAAGSPTTSARATRCGSNG